MQLRYPLHMLTSQKFKTRGTTKRDRDTHQLKKPRTQYYITRSDEISFLEQSGIPQPTDTNGRTKIESGKSYLSDANVASNYSTQSQQKRPTK